MASADPLECTPAFRAPVGDLKTQIREPVDTRGTKRKLPHFGTVDCSLTLGSIANGRPLTQGWNYLWQHVLQQFSIGFAQELF
jgi:hypothetical protein